MNMVMARPIQKKKNTTKRNKYRNAENASNAENTSNEKAHVKKDSVDNNNKREREREKERKREREREREREPTPVRKPPHPHPIKKGNQPADTRDNPEHHRQTQSMGPEDPV